MSLGEGSSTAAERQTWTKVAFHEFTANMRLLADMFPIAIGPLSGRDATATSICEKKCIN